MAWSPDGTKIASGSSDDTLAIWNAKTGKCESTLTVDKAVTSVAFSPDGSKITTCHSKKIQLFDAKTQAKLGSPLSGRLGLCQSCYVKPRRKHTYQWQWRQNHQTVGYTQWKSKVDPERAQVPGKALILRKLSKLSVWSINFLSIFAAKATRIVPALLMKIVILRRPIPRVRWPVTGTGKKRSLNQ